MSMIFFQRKKINNFIDQKENTGISILNQQQARFREILHRTEFSMNGTFHFWTYSIEQNFLWT